MNVLPWYDPTNWAPTASILDSLVQTIERCDFAVLLLADDDRQQVGEAPPHRATRDNVLLELGLCMGMLGRDRVFFLYSDRANFKLPSDIHGITGLKTTFDPSMSPDDKSGALNQACDRILLRVEEVANEHGNKGKQPLPTLVLKVRFPPGKAGKSDDVSHLSSATESILKIEARIDDDAIVPSSRPSPERVSAVGRRPRPRAARRA